MTHMPEPSFHYQPMLDCATENLARPVSEWTFKTDQRLREVTEHVDPDQGHVLLAAALEHFAHLPLLERVPPIALENDAIGQPYAAYQTYFEPLGITCSPQNFQWLWHALLFMRHLRTQNVSQTHIFEIGAGTGGLALYITRLADLFDLTIESYTTIDVPEMAALQAAYFAQISAPVKTIHGGDGDVLAELVSRDGTKALFSCWAFAEFGQETQDWYAEHLVRHVDHGWLVWNTSSLWAHRDRNEIYTFMDKPVTIEDDRIPDYGTQAMGNWDMKFVHW